MSEGFISKELSISITARTIRLTAFPQTFSERELVLARGKQGLPPAMPPFGIPPSALL